MGEPKNKSVPLADLVQDQVSTMTQRELMAFRRALADGLPEFILQAAELARQEAQTRDVSRPITEGKT